MTRSRWLQALVFSATLSLASGCAAPQTTLHPGRHPTSHLVQLNVGHGPVDREVQVSRGNQDMVYWKNNDVRGQTLRFEKWPFIEPWQEIQIKVGQTTNYFHVFDDGHKGKVTFHYHVVPGIKGDTGAPDPPAVVVND
jgi:hypothetical protein